MQKSINIKTLVANAALKELKAHDAVLVITRSGGITPAKSNGEFGFGYTNSDSTINCHKTMESCLKNLQVDIEAQMAKYTLQNINLIADAKLDQSTNSIEVFLNENVKDGVYAVACSYQVFTGSASEIEAAGKYVTQVYDKLLSMVEANP
jgi:hypothetical protein